MKFLLALLLSTAVCSPPARAAEHRYDVVSRLLAPFTSVLARSSKGPRALHLVGRVERLTGLPPELVGTSAELTLQAPDRARIVAPILGEVVTIARDRQQVWAAPGARVQPLLDRALAERKAGLEPTGKLAPLELPFPEKQLVFLPALLTVTDQGSQSLDGIICRVLDLALMPEVERSIKEKGWSARVWVRPDDRPARLTLSRPGFELTVRFEVVEFSQALPEETWTPPAEGAVILDALRFRQLLQAFGRQG